MESLKFATEPFVQSRPLPPLGEQEKVDYYDRRIEPACLKKLFKEMSEANLTHIFEDTYDYNHSAVWEVCEDDFEPFRNSIVRPDVLESLLTASSDILNQVSQNNVIPFRPTSKNPEARGTERFKRNRRGFLVLAWDTDIDMLLGLKAVSHPEFLEFARSHNAGKEDVLNSFYEKLKQWHAPSERPLPKDPEDCPFPPEVKTFLESLSDGDESECYQKFIEIFINFPRTYPVSLPSKILAQAR